MSLGRTVELAELDRLLESVVGGRSGRLLVVGDPGIGKTDLLEQAGRHARQRGVTVVAWTVTQASEVLTDAPVLVLLDDAQRAAPDVLTAALDLADRAAPGTAIVVATRPQASVLRTFAAWERLTLGPLGHDDAVALLVEALGDHARPSIVYRLAAALEGNPRALRDVPGLLTADERSGRARLPAHLPIPASIEAAWAQALAPLPDSTRAAALDLAVAGPHADLLSAMSADDGWDDDDVAALVDAGLVTADAPPAFVHPVVAGVVVHQGSAGQVRETHRRAAGAATALGLSPRIIVDHLAASVSTIDVDIAEQVHAQAERAEETDQLTLAADAWLIAARLTPAGPLRTERALRALRLVIENGLDYADTEGLLMLLAGHQLDAECALWVEWLRSLQRSEADPSAAVSSQWATIRRAREASPATLRALLWDAAMNAWTVGDVDAGLRAARTYVDVAGRMDLTTGVEPPWTGTALVAAGLMQSGDVHRAMTLRAEAIAAAGSTEPETLPFDRLLSIVFLDDLLLDASPEAGDRLQLAIQRCPDRTPALACLRGIEAWRARALGDWAAAHRALTVGRPLAAATGAVGAQVGMAALAIELAALEGDDALLASQTPRLRARVVGLGDRRRLATLDRATGLRALAGGRLDDATVALTAAADVPFLGRGLRDAVIPARIDLVEVAVRLHDLDEARRRIDQVVPILAAMDTPAARAAALRVRGLVAGDTDLLNAAVAAHAEASDSFEAARTHLLLAEALRRQRDRSRARLHLISASRVFEHLGARPWLGRAQVELRACGGSAPTAGVDTLTPQERAVAEAVAAGRTNREVADALFLSPRTVEYHLGSVYRKLGVHGRAALVRAFSDSA